MKTTTNLTDILASRFVVKAMCQADRDAVLANPAADQGGQTLYPIGHIWANSDRAASAKLKKMIADGKFPADAVCDPEE